jgi:LysM repeat protein
VKTQLSQLNAVVYNYDGSDHEPNIVRLLWGSLIFYGRLDSMSVTYKLFKPSGEPLRALVKLAFTGFVSKSEESLKAKRSSPDLTHVVEVKAGDTLPLLCNRIYKDCSYYLDVAEVNGIDHIRDLKPGQKLYFPPLS